MTDTDKAAERSTLILQLGRLLAPLYYLVEQQTPPTSVEYQITAAKYRPDLSGWRGMAIRFTIINGVSFGQELDDIFRGPQNMFNELGQLARDTSYEPSAIQERLRSRLKDCETQTIAAINKVPIDWAPRLLEEQTPFSTYMRIRDVMDTAKKRIHYFDRYLDSDFFSLYLRGIDRSLEIRLVTTKGNQNYGVVCVHAVSRLAAQEFLNFRLVECDPSDMHDRNLRIDDMIFFLGTSTKDAGRYPTNFSPSDSTPNGHSILDSILSKGTTIT